MVEEGATRSKPIRSRVRAWGFGSLGGGRGRRRRRSGTRVVEMNNGGDSEVFIYEGGGVERKGR